MDYQELKALGGIVSQALVKKEIQFRYHAPLPEDQWADPAMPEFADEATDATATIYIRKRTSRDFLDVVRAPESQQAFINLFRCVCNEDGTPLFPSVEDAGHLAEWLLVPMLTAVNEVNSFLPKRFPPKTSSGANSLSPSAAGASGNGRKRSTRKSGRSG